MSTVGRDFPYKTKVDKNIRQASPSAPTEKSRKKQGKPRDQTREQMDKIMETTETI